MMSLLQDAITLHLGVFGGEISPLGQLAGFERSTEIGGSPTPNWGMTFLYRAQHSWGLRDSLENPVMLGKVESRRKRRASKHGLTQQKKLEYSVCQSLLSKAAQ